MLLQSGTAFRSLDTILPEIRRPTPQEELVDMQRGLLVMLGVPENMLNSDKPAPGPPTDEEFDRLIQQREMNEAHH